MKSPGPDISSCAKNLVPGTGRVNGLWKGGAELPWIHLQRDAAPPHTADWKTQVFYPNGISAYLLISRRSSGVTCGEAQRRGGSRSRRGPHCHVGARGRGNGLG